MNTATAQPIYMRAQSKYRSLDDELPEPDYEALRQLLLPYDSKVSLERAKAIGEFLLRVNLLANKAQMRYLDKQAKQKIQGVNNEERK
jgi:hypothetical protein